MNRFSKLLFVADSFDDDSAAFGHAANLANNNQAMISVVGLVDALSTREPRASNASELLNAIVERRQDQIW
ncbi:MAG: hypothetical protein HOC23_11735 [Halieaceae bacterium]|jgi:hypothetical protein|nr:hypothetical protein [Halieaceae bacterium]